MKADLSSIVFILDRSGSMGMLRDTAISGFNKFVEEQLEVPGEATLRLVLFNVENVINSAVSLVLAPRLNRDNYVPEGGTALNDAVADTIETVGRELAAMPEADRPAKVIVAILTDGQENSSRRFSRAQVADMIKHQQEVYGWVFIFLGANMDAFAEAQAYNIPVANAANFSATRDGLEGAYSRTSGLVTSNRSN